MTLVDHKCVELFHSACSVRGTDGGALFCPLYMTTRGTKAPSLTGCRKYLGRVRRSKGQAEGVNCRDGGTEGFSHRLARGLTVWLRTSAPGKAVYSSHGTDCRGRSEEEVIMSVAQSHLLRALGEMVIVALTWPDPAVPSLWSKLKVSIPWADLHDVFPRVKEKITV